MPSRQVIFKNIQKILVDRGTINAANLKRLYFDYFGHQLSLDDGERLLDLLCQAEEHGACIIERDGHTIYVLPPKVMPKVMPFKAQSQSSSISGVACLTVRNDGHLTLLKPHRLKKVK